MKIQPKTIRWLKFWIEMCAVSIGVGVFAYGIYVFIHQLNLIQ